MFKTITHALWPSKCVKEAVWVRGSLQCPCGNVVALRYSFDGATKLYVYPEFDKYRKEIIASQTTISDKGELVGAVCFDEFSDFMQELRLTPLNTIPAEEDIDNNKEDT